RTYRVGRTALSCPPTDARPQPRSAKRRAPRATHRPKLIRIVSLAARRSFARYRAMSAHSLSMPTPDQALPGRGTPMPVPERHRVLGNPLRGPFPDGLQQAAFGMGCFWGAERRFWQQPGVWTTAAGYAGGLTPNPTYEEVCSGLTGHAEVVLVVF